MERQLGRVRNSFAPKRGVKDLTSILFNIHSKTFHSISELGSRAVKEITLKELTSFWEKDGNANQ